ncbi:MAG: hypothetical protein NT002_13910 [candidate division Zixibacteria bacterium]|nr:hypothetical protein [candidate division Zixibacteria bacterium]
MEQISDMARIAQRVFNTTILGTDKEEIRRAFEIFRRDYRAFLDAGHKDKEW